MLHFRVFVKKCEPGKLLKFEESWNLECKSHICKERESTWVCEEKKLNP